MFMCHQTIEKALKGIFVTKCPNEELPYIHKLVRLAILCGIIDEMSGKQLALLDVLNPLTVAARYPVNKEPLWKSLSQERCEKLIKEMEIICQSV